MFLCLKIKSLSTRKDTENIKEKGKIYSQQNAEKIEEAYKSIDKRMQKKLKKHKKV